MDKSKIQLSQLLTKLNLKLTLRLVMYMLHNMKRTSKMRTTQKYRHILCLPFVTFQGCPYRFWRGDPREGGQGSDEGGNSAGFATKLKGHQNL